MRSVARDLLIPQSRRRRRRPIERRETEPRRMRMRGRPLFAEGRSTNHAPISSAIHWTEEGSEERRETSRELRRHDRRVEEGGETAKKTARVEEEWDEKEWGLMSTTGLTHLDGYDLR